MDRVILDIHSEKWDKIRKNTKKPDSPILGTEQEEQESGESRTPLSFRSEPQDYAYCTSVAPTLFKSETSFAPERGGMSTKQVDSCYEYFLSA